jgi:hypothetical protein
MANRSKPPEPHSEAPPGAAAPEDAPVTGPTNRASPASTRRTPPVADRITVSLVTKAAADLQKTYERTHMSKTDIINRAVSLYEFVDAELDAGAELIIRRDGRDYYVKVL